MDKLSKKKRSWNMSRIKSKNTTPEMAVRRYLLSKKYSFKTNYEIKGKPDIVFVRKKLAVFIHGCFWHRHGCNNSTMPKTNSEFWMNKLNGNAKRDKRVRAFLKVEGWKIFVLWECRLEKNLLQQMERLEKFIKLKKV